MHLTRINYMAYNVIKHCGDKAPLGGGVGGGVDANTTDVNARSIVFTPPTQFNYNLCQHKGT